MDGTQFADQPTTIVSGVDVLLDVAMQAGVRGELPGRGRGIVKRHYPSHVVCGVVRCPDDASADRLHEALVRAMAESDRSCGSSWNQTSPAGFTRDEYTWAGVIAVAMIVVPFVLGLALGIMVTWGVLR